MDLLHKLKKALRPSQHSLLDQIEDLPSRRDLLDVGELPPSRATVQRAKALIEDALPLIDTLQHVDLDVHPSEGSIRIVWSQGAKTLKLVVPVSQNPYLYHQDGEEYSAVPYSSEKFAEWLNWLSSDRKIMSPQFHYHTV